MNEPSATRSARACIAIAVCLVIVGTLGALLKSKIDRVREAAARMNSV